MINKINRIYGFRILIVIGVFYPVCGYARLARLSGSRDGTWNYLYMPYSDASFLFYVIILTMLALVFIFLIGHKKRIAHRVHQFSENDTIWARSYRHNQVKQALMAYYAAIQDNNVSLARPYLTSGLIAKLEESNKENLSAGIKFRFKHLEDIRIETVSAQRGQEGSKDRFWALVYFSMIRYWVDSASGQEIEGNAYISQQYKHLCKFVRDDQNWLTDRIDGYNGVMDIINIFPDRE